MHKGKFYLTFSVQSFLKHYYVEHCIARNRGNTAFLMGLCFLLGMQKTGKFFFRKEKAVGQLCQETNKSQTRSDVALV